MFPVREWRPPVLHRGEDGPEQVAGHPPHLRPPPVRPHSLLGLLLEIFQEKEAKG